MNQQENQIYSFRGSLFEVANNYGVLKAIIDTTINGIEICEKYMEKYDQSIPMFNYAEYAKRYLDLTGDTTVTKDEIVRMMETADASGYDMFRSYIIGLENEHGNPKRKRKQRTTFDECHDKGSEPQFEVVYAQIGMYHLYDENNTEYNVSRQIDLFNEMMSKNFENIEMSRLSAAVHKDTGEFLNADTLIFLRRKVSVKNYKYIYQYALFVSDESGYVGDSALHIHDYKSLRYSLALTAGGFYGQSYFRNVATKGEGEYNYEEIRSAIRLSTDKGAAKANQAAAYAASFLEYLTKSKAREIEEPMLLTHLVTETRENRMKYIQHVSAIGFTNREYACINMMNPVQKDLNSYRNWYKEYAKKHSDLDKNLKEKCKELKREFRSQFEKSNYDNTINASDTKDWITVETTYHGRNPDKGELPTENEYVITTQGYRDAHRAKVSAALMDPNIEMLYLTGAPGIGKTTSTLMEIKKLDTAFVIYISPRTAINSGFMTDFVDRVGGPVITINSDLPPGTMKAKGSEEDISILRSALAHADIKVETDDSNIVARKYQKGYFEASDSKNGEHRNADFGPGILERLGKCVQNITEYAYKNKKLSHIGICLSTQAIGSVNDIKRIKAISILCGLDNSRFGNKAIELFLKSYKNIFVIIDEVSGDDTGIRSYNDINQDIKQNILKPAKKIGGTNIKFIVMDASIADKKSAGRYTRGDTGAYISVQKTDDAAEKKTLPYGIQSYDGDEKSIKYINGDTFPAKDVHIRVKFATQAKTRADIIQEILLDVDEFVKARKTIDTTDGPRKEQCIVYLQDKKGLDEISTYLKRDMHIDNEILYGDSSASDKAKIRERMNAADGKPVLLMTSSGSRGMSFKYVTSMFLVVPGFDLESNLMEIVQAIYRGRGDEKVDTEQGTTLTFYHNISKKMNPPKDINDEEQKQLARRHQLMREIDICTISMLINDCFRSRVYGKGAAGYKIIPFGRQTKKDRRNDEFCEIEKHIETIRRAFGSNENSQILKYCEVANIDGIKFEIPGEFQHREFFTLLRNANAALAAKNFDEYKKIQCQIPPYAVLEGCIVIRESKTQHRVAYHNTNTEKLNENAAREELKNKPRNIQIAGDDIIEYVKSQEGMNNVHEMSSRENGYHYFAYPAEAFGLTIRSEEYDTDEDEMTFLQIMYTLMSSRAKITNLLPVVSCYKTGQTPFICFRSEDMAERMTNRFLNDELLMSTDTNLLGLIFAGKEKTE